MPAVSADCQAFWQAFVGSLAGHDPRRFARPDAFGFGGQAEIADELAALVLAGRKRATTSLLVEYSQCGEPLPKAGDLSIVLNGSDQPVAIIERTAVELLPFSAVGADYAQHEGEGDGSLGHWVAVHTCYFNRILEPLGGRLEAATLVICQSFRLVWPRREWQPNDTEPAAAAYTESR